MSSRAPTTKTMLTVFEKTIVRKPTTEITSRAAKYPICERIAPLVARPRSAPLRWASSTMKATPVAPENRQKVLMKTRLKMRTT